MGKYFLTLSVLKGPWDQVFAAFWQRYPNPYSKHVLTEDILHREVTEDQKLLSRRLLTKTNRMPRWAERFFPSNVAHSVYILEDSIVDPQNRTMTTFTWNINHARLMVVEERCVYRENPENSGWTEVQREAWVSSTLFGVSRAVQVKHHPKPWWKLQRRQPRRPRRLPWQQLRKQRTWLARQLLKRSSNMFEKNSVFLLWGIECNKIILEGLPVCN
uniref:PRELI domain containing 1 n=1 Tax=Podarcis muralis TaxID=64176 RepID=A0A670IJI0_PODMU